MNKLKRDETTYSELEPKISNRKSVVVKLLLVPMDQTEHFQQTDNKTNTQSFYRYGIESFYAKWCKTFVAWT